MGWIYSGRFKFFISALLISACATADQKCRGVYFSNRYYDIDILKDGLNKIHQITLNRNDNTLYFTFDQIARVPTRVLGYLDISTRTSGLVEGIRNATCIAIDQAYNKVYVGGSEGIFRINSYKVPERIPVQDNIQSMYFKDVLFYTNSRNEAYMYDSGHINPVFELQGVAAEKIILDDDHNIFFTQGKTLFRVKIGTRVVNSHERYRTNILTTDFDDKPYISTNDGVYVYNKYKYVFDKVSDITGLKALTFNKAGEPIYSVVDLIVHLKYNPVRCIESVIYNRN
ncbi:ommochrome-binding protein-like [Pectinophora gossypiella]|uniref:ommochrome-binding protein-like n=1 Tax=Pectinophora gossypiella TaxID=13191 RepID=UPI00214DFBB2|nr:ommochrome-binding protein-like [Pectinophora gossypiella]